MTEKLEKISDFGEMSWALGKGAAIFESYSTSILRALALFGRLDAKRILGSSASAERILLPYSISFSMPAALAMELNKLA